MARKLRRRRGNVAIIMAFSMTVIMLFTALAIDVSYLRTTEFERAQAVWQRRFSVAPNSPEERARQMRFLAARGFDSQAIGQVLRAAAQAQREAQTPQEQEARE